MLASRPNTGALPLCASCECPEGTGQVTVRSMADEGILHGACLFAGTANFVP